MVKDNGLRTTNGEPILNPVLSSDCGLQSARMKSDLVVIAGQQTAVNTFPFLVHTARQINRVSSARSGSKSRRTTKARLAMGVKS